MARTVSIGKQDFRSLRESGYFYVDKTDFITRWWQGGDDVTLVCRPRRSGKTLNMRMVECFLSPDNAGRGEELFDGLKVWKSEEMRSLQGTVPVVFVSFAGCKGSTFADVRARMCQEVAALFVKNGYLLESPLMSEERARFETVRTDMDDAAFAGSLNLLCGLLERHWGTKPVVLLDEYDTPMQEAWVMGCWDQMVGLMRPFMNATFKTNASLGRGLITGITRVSRESIFSDLNNLAIASVTSPKYEDCFGFTEEETFSALDEFGLSEDRDEVKRYYDGFTFGEVSDIYNPWSITKFLDESRFDLFWANTSGNALIANLVRTGDEDLKADFKQLLEGGTLEKVVDEQIVFSELGTKPGAIWSLMLAAGYVKVVGKQPRHTTEPRSLKITNHETELFFEDMVRGWFGQAGSSYNRFVKALLADDVEGMNGYLGQVVRACASSFDSGAHPSETSEPERFYHGLVLGMLVDLRGRYTVESNRESGFGRCDVMLVPNPAGNGSTNGPAGDSAVILEFKVFDPAREQTLDDTVRRAHEQVERRAYATALQERGIPVDRIRTYGIAFRGKEVLVG